MSHASQGLKVTRISDLMNKIFLIYKDIIPSENLGIEFNWEKEVGVYSEEIEDTLDDSVFGKYFEVEEIKDSTDMYIRLTDKGSDYAQSNMVSSDSEMVNTIHDELTRWNVLHKQDSFLSYVSDRFREYLASDERAKVFMTRARL